MKPGKLKGLGEVDGEDEEGKRGRREEVGMLREKESVVWRQREGLRRSWGRGRWVEGRGKANKGGLRGRGETESSSQNLSCHDSNDESSS